MLTAINPVGQMNPPGVSQAVLIRGGNLLLLSGHVSTSPVRVMGADLEAQLVQTFENLAGTLNAAGVDFSAVTRLTYYIVNYQPALLPTILSVRDRFINLEKPPASALVGVASLALPNLLVEIDTIAVAP